MMVIVLALFLFGQKRNYGQNGGEAYKVETPNTGSAQVPPLLRGILSVIYFLGFQFAPL